MRSTELLAALIITAVAAGCASPPPGSADATTAAERVDSEPLRWASAFPGADGVLVVNLVGGPGARLILISTNEARVGNEYKGGFLAQGANVTHVAHAATFEAPMGPGHPEGVAAYVSAAGVAQVIEGAEETLPGNKIANVMEIAGEATLILLWADQPAGMEVEIELESGTWLEVGYVGTDVEAWRMEDDQGGAAVGTAAARAHRGAGRTVGEEGGALVGYVETIVTDKGAGEVRLAGTGRQERISFGTLEAPSPGCPVRTDWQYHHFAWDGPMTTEVDYAGYGPSTGVFFVVASVPADLLMVPQWSSEALKFDVPCVN